MEILAQRTREFMSVVLGINAFHAGASAAIVVDGVPIAAVAEERLNRVKYYARFPAQAIHYCLDAAGLEFKDIDYVAVGRDSSSNQAAKWQYALSHPSQWGRLAKMKINSRVRSLSGIRELLIEECGAAEASLRFQMINIEHHIAHIASSYFISPWDSAAGFSIDGSGDFVTCMFARCEGKNIEVVRRIFMPNSLGIFYTAIGQLCGYKNYGDEGKVMGLAPLGKDTFVEELGKTYELNSDGLRLNFDYFVSIGEDQDNICISDTGQMMMPAHYRDSLVEIFGPPREAKSEFTQREMDLAYAVQYHFEKIYLHMLGLLYAEVPLERVAIAGGCALNSVANGKIYQQTPFTDTCITPAAGDDGLALGAALYVSQSVSNDGERYVMKHAYWGPEHTEEEMQAALDERGVEYCRLEREDLLGAVADEIAAGNVIGWYQGRAEWGPRALGNRSILANPGHPNMKEILNARVKGREWFRPFAPSVLAERQDDLFERSEPSPFMLHVYKVKEQWRERLPAITHVDGTGRLQTVTAEQNQLYYDLIKQVDARTGIPVVLNTSFNENEPIVGTPAEAIDCYLRTKMDVLALGPFLCRKAKG